MRIMQSLRLKRIMLALGLFPMVLFAIGQGCGAFKSGSSSSNLTSMCTSLPGVDKTITVIPGQNTVSVAYNHQVLDNMVSCTGIVSASAGTEQEWQDRRNSLSEYGQATQMSGPMMMGIAAVAGEVCNDLYVKESALPADSRLIYNNLDFAAGAGMASSTNLGNVVDRLAISCWSRNATADERADLISTATQIMSEAGTSANRAGALSVCTAVLASLQAIQM